jgi:hypothetical protein
VAIGTVRRSPAGIAPITDRQKWRAIILATVALVPVYWLLLAAMVSAADDDEGGLANPAAAATAALCLLPFVFVLLAFLSEHPKAPGAALRAMGMSVLVGVGVSVLAADAVSGIVAGVGAGGMQALRPEPGQSWRPRAVAVAVASAYTFVLVRTAGAITLLPAPVFPFTALGVADHLAARRRVTGG